jgi:sporulation protein YlmC with PRC-barrel domain
MRLSLMMVVAGILMISQLDRAYALDKSEVLKGSDLIGMNVEERDGKRLGEIKDLVVNPTDGEIDYIVLDYGGFLGVGHKYFAVPWKALTFTGDMKRVILDVTNKDLKQAPGFDKDNWPDLSGRDLAIMIYEFYGVPMPSGRTPAKTPAH